VGQPGTRVIKNFSVLDALFLLCVGLKNADNLRVHLVKPVVGADIHNLSPSLPVPAYLPRMSF
jgi:hypothetical protein